MSNQVEQANSKLQDTNTKAQIVETQEREWGTRIFLGFLFVIACGYATMLMYHVSRPPGTVAVDDGLMEQCRQICLRYGLVSTGNVRKDAEAYLHVAQKQHLTERLAEILSETTFTPAKSQDHPLLNQTAPDFTLPDDFGKAQTLRELAKHRPLVVVFYLGYGCSHCVAQLIAIDKDLHYFRELDADVVAISADESTHTAEKFLEYGRFHFPVLADVDKAVGRAWGVNQPQTDGHDEFTKHGTFIVDRKGKVIFAEIGVEPFLDNESLLHIVARSQGLAPAAPPEELAAAAQ